MAMNTGTVISISIFYIFIFVVLGLFGSSQLQASKDLSSLPTDATSAAGFFFSGIGFSISGLGFWNLILFAPLSIALLLVGVEVVQGFIP